MFHVAMRKTSDVLFILGAGVVLLTVVPLSIALDWLQDRR